MGGLAVFLGAALLAGRPGEALLLLFLLFSHEFAHLAVAIGFGYRPISLRLLPCGGFLVLDRPMIGDTTGEAAVAAAGPLHHFVLLWLAAHAPGFKEAIGPLWPFFLRANLSLALFNLLPVFPLDGGRLLRAGLSRRQGPLVATKTVRRVGFFVSLSFLFFASFLFIYGGGPLPFLGGLYLLYLEKKGQEENVLAGELHRFARTAVLLGRGGVTPLRIFAVREKALVWPSLTRVTGRGYILFWILDASGRTLGWLTQEEALAALVRHGLGVEFGLAIKGEDRKGVDNGMSNHFRAKLGERSHEEPIPR
ncbi:MAG: site-2 protease family protein [Bacillota bacterium]